MAPNRLNWQLLDNSVIRLVSDLALENKRQAFSMLVISNLLNTTYEEAREADTDGPSDRGIDALFFDERDGQLVLHLFNFKYTDDFEKSGASFPGNELDKVISFVDDVMNLRADQIRKSCNPILADKVEYLWNNIVSPNFEIHIRFCSNIAPFNSQVRRRADDHFRPHQFISIEELGTDDIVERIIRSKVKPINGEVQVTENQYFPRIDGTIRGLIATIRATELVKILTDPHRPTEINKAAFNENIRVYLGNKNEVNRSILSTALGVENSEFWYLNNGITIVCEQFKYNDVASPVVALKNFQIVNGGQTAHALFEAYHQDAERIRNVFLLARIYETSADDIKLKVAAATNNQTRINARDLKSNDPIQLRLEEGLSTLGFCYERKKDQFVDRSADKRIDALRAGQIYLAYYGKEPDKAKTQSNRIFGEWYPRIFNDEITPQKLLCPIMLANEIEKRKNGVRGAVRTSLRRDVPDEFMLEGAFHVLYVVGLLCTKHNVRLDDYDCARLEIDEAIRITRDVAREFRGKSFYKFFRSVESKDVLFNRVFEIERELDLEHRSAK